MTKFGDFPTEGYPIHGEWRGLGILFDGVDNCKICLWLLRISSSNRDHNPDPFISCIHLVFRDIRVRSARTDTEDYSILRFLWGTPLMETTIREKKE